MSAEATYKNLSKKTTTEVVTVISRTTTKSANSSCVGHCNTALCKKRQYSYIKSRWLYQEAPATLDTVPFKKTEGCMRGWERQTQGHCNNKEKISSPADILQEEERGGINAKKNGGKKKKK